MFVERDLLVGRELTVPPGAVPMLSSGPGQRQPMLKATQMPSRDLKNMNSRNASDAESELDPITVPSISSSCLEWVSLPPSSICHVSADNVHAFKANYVSSIIKNHGFRHD